MGRPMPHLAVLLALLAVAGCQRVHRLYDGPKRPAAEIAHLRNTGDVWARVIDGEIVPHDKPDDLGSVTYELAPGPHRIEAKYHFAQTSHHGNYVSYSSSEAYNMWSLYHDFEAGERYRLSRNDIKGGDEAYLPVLRNSAGEIVAETDRTRRPTTPSHRGTTLAGVAFDDQYTATGRPIYLLRDGTVTRGLLRHSRDPRDRFEDADVLQAVVYGYGVGFFEFLDVPPGDYVVW